MKTINLSIKGIETFNDTLIKELPQDVETLYLWNNDIKSFEHSEGLPRNLKNLHLGFNQISSLKGCEGLPKTLKLLTLWNNQIKSFKELYIESWSKEQLLLRYTQFELENVLELVKFLQRHQDFKYILNEIKYNPRLERTKSKSEEGKLKERS